MTDSVCVPISNELLNHLVARYPDGFTQLIEDVVQDFLERTSDDWTTLTDERHEGYVWDQIFLPAGTELRTKHHGEWQLAKLEKGKFLYNGKPFSSPAKVCNAMRGDTSNTAWITLEIKRPKEVSFRLADRFRRS